MGQLVQQVRPDHYPSWLPKQKRGWLADLAPRSCRPKPPLSEEFPSAFMPRCSRPHPNTRRCGQRWAKAGRPDLRPGEELGTRRPEVKDKERSGWSDGRHHKFARPSYSPTNSDSETSRG